MNSKLDRYNVFFPKNAFLKLRNHDDRRFTTFEYISQAIQLKILTLCQSLKIPYIVNDRGPGPSERAKKT